MSTLGELLRQRGWITEKQLAAAMERQQQLGGRLGTCLMELGMVNEDLLLQVLSEQLGVPAATQHDLHSIPPEVTALLPAKLAIRGKAVPFRAGGSRVDVALLDVGDLALEDELTFVIGKRVNFHIATEVRIAEALARYYGHGVAPRLVGLAQRLAQKTKPTGTNSRAESRTPVKRSRVTAPGATPTVTAAPAKRVAQLDPEPETRPPAMRQGVPEVQRIALTDEEQKMLSSARSGIEPHQVEPTPEESFVERIAGAETASEIGDALLDVLGTDFIRVLLFRVAGSQHEIIGWLAHGPEIDRDWFFDYRVPVDRAAIFRQLNVTKQPYLGKIGDASGHAALARCWGGSLDHDCLMLPIFVRDHLVSVVYADRIALALGPTDLDAAKKLVGKAAIAFERCILRRKLRAD